MSHDSDNKWNQPLSPPPPMFAGKKEKDLVKQVNDEVLEKVVGQQIAYYPISMEHTNYNATYGEAINKSFLNPIRVYALVKYESEETKTTNLGVDRLENITVSFHKKRLSEDQNLFVREGDFILFGQN